jgi:hypothetical protein
MRTSARAALAAFGVLSVLLVIVFLVQMPAHAVSHPKTLLVLMVGAVGIWCILRAAQLVRFRSGREPAEKRLTFADRFAKWNMVGLVAAGILVLLANVFELVWLGRIAVYCLIAAFLWIPVTILVALLFRISSIVSSTKNSG